MSTQDETDTSEKVDSDNGSNLEWKPHLYRVGPHGDMFDEPPPHADDLRKSIEPWLSAVFQSEHLSLLLGSGFTTSVAVAAGKKPVGMERIRFDGAYGDKIKTAAEDIAKKSARGTANFEDDIRAAKELLRGLEILGDDQSEELRKNIDEKLAAFLKSIIKSEESIRGAIEEENDKGLAARNLLVSFLLSFASRAASRERLNLFTTNYDRLIEYGCDLAGLHVIDRFVGVLSPIFRAGRLNIDLHYNPPGIRGEPRYMEGVIRLFKLHGSLDWRQERKQIKRYGIPFGSSSDHPDFIKEPVDSVMVYPNAAKDMETSDYPYAELFRDFAAAICRPNSVLVTYGYGFGDDHFNRVIRDMLTILSTHLVIISYDNPGGRIERFCTDGGHDPQVSLLIGSHFGNLPDLVKHYLPKPAIDPISARKTKVLEARGLVTSRSPGDGVERQERVQGDETHDDAD